MAGRNGGTVQQLRRETTDGGVGQEVVSPVAWRRLLIDTLYEAAGHELTQKQIRAEVARKVALDFLDPVDDHLTVLREWQLVESAGARKVRLTERGREYALGSRATRGGSA